MKWKWKGGNTQNRRTSNLAPAGSSSQYRTVMNEVNFWKSARPRTRDARLNLIKNLCVRFDCVRLGTSPSLDVASVSAFIKSLMNANRREKMRGIAVCCRLLATVVALVSFPADVGSFSVGLHQDSFCSSSLSIASPSRCRYVGACTSRTLRYARPRSTVRAVASSGLDDKEIASLFASALSGEFSNAKQVCLPLARRRLCIFEKILRANEIQTALIDSDVWYRIE